MDIKKEFEKLILLCEQLDYSDLESIFEYADNELSNHSWELALIVMINIITKDIKWLDEAIYDHIIIVVEAEGNRQTYNYIKHKYEDAEDFFVKKRLQQLMAYIEDKYNKLGIRL